MLSDRVAPAEDYVSWDTKTPNKIRMGTEAPANYAPLCIQNMMRNTVKEYPDNKVGFKSNLSHFSIAFRPDSSTGMDENLL